MVDIFDIDPDAELTSQDLAEVRDFANQLLEQRRRERRIQAGFRQARIASGHRPVRLEVRYGHR